MNRLTKLPYEEFPRVCTFAQEMVEDEAIIELTIECVNLATGASTKSSIVFNEATVGKTVFFVLKNGVLGESHKITVTVRTSLDNIFELELILEIRRPDSDSFPKQPSEEFSVANIFEDDLETGDTIASHTVTATKLQDNSDATATVIKGSGVDTSNHQAFFKLGLMQGLDGEYYDVSIKIVTALGYKYEKIITMRLVNK